MNYIDFLFQDFRANHKNTKGKILCILYRAANFSVYNRFYKFAILPYLFLYKIAVEWILGVEIPYNVRIGKNFKLFHGQGLVINNKSLFGENITLRHNTTIGNSKPNGVCPIIKDNVNVGANCVIIGDITIGENSLIGAGSVVVKDIPPNSVVVGNPARIIRMLSD